MYVCMYAWMYASMECMYVCMYVCPRPPRCSLGALLPCPLFRDLLDAVQNRLPRRPEASQRPSGRFIFRHNRVLRPPRESLPRWAFPPSKLRRYSYRSPSIPMAAQVGFPALNYVWGRRRYNSIKNRRPKQYVVNCFSVKAVVQKTCSSMFFW